MDIVTLIEKMKECCPLDCECIIRGTRAGIELQWYYLVNRKPYVLTFIVDYNKTLYAFDTTLDKANNAILNHLEELKHAH